MAELQTVRPVEIITPLGDDVLLFHRMTATEELGRLFQFELDLLSMDPKIQFEKLLGQNVTIRLELPKDKTRYFNGFVSRFSQEGTFDDFNAYSVTVHPWLWFLTRTADCRIFQGKTVPEIIKEVFKDHGFTDYEESLSGKYRTWEYCVQYRETDFNFVSRLMEQEGIYYYFKHEINRHILVFSDSVSSHEAYPGYEKLPYFPPDEHLRRERDHIYDWNISQEVQPGIYALNEFDFTRPKANLEVKSSIKRDHARAALEIYDYPGEYPDTGDGENYVRARIEELQTEHEQVQGQANARGLSVGSLFELVDYPRTDQNREYLIVSATHQVESDAYSSGSGAEAAEVYSCSFTALHSKQPYRAARTTPKPMVQGPQTAIVVGPSGEEIYTDKYGRVKVSFHWDRYSKSNETSSCWVRVAQVWAGTKWGGIQIPRIGQEVIIEFLEGDPDHPLITGRVYNNNNMPPYDLPANATQSGIKSRSSKGGNADNFNEFRFEDKKGEEEVYIHAEKDWNIQVKNAESETVGSGISTNAGASISRNAGKDHSRTADDNIMDKAGKNITTESGKNMGLKAGGSYQLLTNLGIHLKAMNFVAAMIESGAKKAAEAIQKGAATTALTAAAAGAQAGATGDGGDAASAAGGAAAAGGEATGLQALAALSPAIESGVGELQRLSDQAATRGENLSGPVNETIAAADQLGNAIESGASPEAIAEAAMSVAGSAAQAFGDAKKLVEEMLPQIPSIVMWAMKDISARALWSMSLSTKVKDINISAENKDINVKAKANIKLEAETKDLNVKATKKNVLITGKEEVNVKAEDKKLVIEAGKDKVFVKSPKQIFLKCGSASISMAKSGNIVIKGAKINIKGSSAVQVKGTPVKLN